MLVKRAKVAAILAALTVSPAGVAAAQSSARGVDWTGSIAAASLSPEDAERAFARPPIDASVDPVVRVDESALRYYASQHAQARVEAEIRRLRALYPGWEPPADLYRPAGGEDQALWDLYGKGRIDDLKLEIERRMARQHGWRPSPEMIEKLRRKEKRLDLVAASDRGDWTAVTSIAEREPLLIDGADLDVIWRVAEATAKTGTEAHALDLYRLALSGATTPDERLGTMRKAITVLGPEPVAPLFAEEKKGEFEPLRLDLARARIGEWLRPEASGEPIADDLDRLTTAARRDDGGAGDAALLGWVELKRNKPAAAFDWFATARGRGGDVKATLGAALAADRAGRHDEAIDIAQTKSEDSEVGTLFLDLVAADISGPSPKMLSSERLARFAATIEKLESGDTAQALAWYAFKAHQFEAARAWFAKAMVWRPSAKSAEGHLLSVKALGDRPTFERLLGEYRDRFADLAPVPGFAVLTTVAHKGGPARKSCGMLLSGAARAPADHLAAGWCLMDLDRGEEAVAAFEAARAGDARLVAEAAYGQSLAHLRAGRTADAAAIAASAELTVGRREEIGRIALAQQAIARFGARDWAGALDTLDRRRAHVAEPRDLMTMRGWALYHLGHKSEARDVFAVLDGQMSTRETRMGLAATSLATLGRN